MPAHKTIQRGDSGPDVSAAQKALTARFYYQDGSDKGGYFGNHTYAAVINYQHDREQGEPWDVSWPLKVDGIVGSSTWGRLDPETVKKGSKGSTVLLLQYLLTITRYPPYDPGPLDSVFGDLTEAALKSFQTDNGLQSTGVADSDTWIKLYS